jgi:chaperonin cofactor prefoldin
MAVIRLAWRGMVTLLFYCIPLILFACPRRVVDYCPQRTLEGLDDASTELMMGTGETVMLLGGEVFFETTEEDAVQFCESQVEKLQGVLDTLAAEEAKIIAQQEELKRLLYGRFGKSINLETS